MTDCPRSPGTVEYSLQITSDSFGTIQQTVYVNVMDPVYPTDGPIDPPDPVYPTDDPVDPPGPLNPDDPVDPPGPINTPDADGL
jgi:hypothetical protein